MHPNALYYPYFHVRDDAWLKYAALYWPRLVRFLPPGYPARDSDLIKTLRDELDWVHDLDPYSNAVRAGSSFMAFVRSNKRSLRRRYGIERDSEWTDRLPSNPSDNGGPGYPSWQFRRARADIHLSQIDLTLATYLVEAGLASPHRADGDAGWLGMHPALAARYMTELVDHAAAHNNLHPVTDQVMPHLMVSGLDERCHNDLLATYVSVAVETVVPDDLDDVPIDRIVRLRKENRHLLDDFREYVTAEVERLATVRDVEDLRLFLNGVRDGVRSGVERRLDELRAGVRAAGLRPVRAIGHLKLAAPPTVAAGLAVALDQRPEVVAAVTGAAVLAADLVRLPGRVRRSRTAAVEASPVGYLLQVNRTLDPGTLAARVRRAVRGY